MKVGQCYQNKKNQKYYVVLSVGVSATNATEGDSIVHYKQLDNSIDFFREKTEFLEKFLPVAVQPQLSMKEYQMLAMLTANKGCIDLNNACLGLAGESGEFCDLVKKHTYQGAPLYKEPCMKELGDIMWYIALACELLETDMETVANMNVEKLKKRFPDGFSVERSNNRKKEDI